MRKSKQIEELKHKLLIAEKDIKIQRDIISNLKEANVKLRKENEEDSTKFVKNLNMIREYEAPVKFIRCPLRKTSYLVFGDDHYVKVKLHKGDKPNPEIALIYLLAKNTYDIEKCQELIKNKIIIKPGDSLIDHINKKK